MFLKNSWYVAAWDREIADKPIGRTFLNEPVVMFRDSRRQGGGDGGQVPASPRASVDGQGGRGRSAAMPLSRAALRPDRNLRARAGSGIRSRETAKVKTYPVVERYHWVWIWMGDPALADPATIPDYHYLDSPDWGAKGTYIHVKANWQLIVDNLLDLTHLAFVHELTIGNAAVAENAEVRVKRTPGGVLVTRWMIDKPAPPTYVKAGGFTTNVDRWQFIDFLPPAFLRLSVGATPTGTGAPEGKFDGGINMRNLNAITPETENTSHYFWAQAHDFDVKNEKLTDMIFEQVKTAFLEDKEVFEAQQRVIDHDASGIAGRHPCRCRRHPGPPHSFAAA